MKKPSQEPKRCALAEAMQHLYLAEVRKEQSYRELREAYREFDPENAEAFLFKAEGVKEANSYLCHLLEKAGFIKVIRPETPEQRLLKAIFEDGAKAQGKPNARELPSSKPVGSKTKKKRENTRPASEAKPSEPKNEGSGE